MTCAEMVARALRGLDEATGDTSPFTSSDVLAALNRGQRIFAAATLCIERKAPLVLSAGQCWARPLDSISDYFLTLRASYETATGDPTKAIWGAPLGDEAVWAEADTRVRTGVVRLKPATVADLDALNTAWRVTTGAAPQRYGTLGCRLAYFYPAPAAEFTVDLMYAAMPRALAADEDVSEIPAEYHSAQVDYAVYELPALRWGGSYLAKGLPRFEAFLDAAAKCAAYVRARSLAHRYDRAPMELTAEDRSRLLRSIGAKEAAAA